MPSSIPSRVHHIVTHTREMFGVPGVSIGFAFGQQPCELVMAGTDAAGYQLTHESLFPVASITKLAVALAVLQLHDAGVLNVHDAIVRYLPDAVAASSGVTIRHLLAHTSGLPLSYPEEADIYALDLTWPRIAQACLRTPLAHAPNAKVHYSDVGYSLLAVIVERCTSQPFPAALQTLVLDPLGIEAYLGVEPPRRPAIIDVGDSMFAGTSLEFYNSPFFRALGEPTGGMLTTIDGALRLVRAYHDVPLNFLTAETRAAARSNQTDGLGGGIMGWFDLPHCPWGLGPGLWGTFPPLVPQAASPTSFGHFGASGCFVWCDPAANIAWAIFGTQVADSGWCNGSVPAIGAALLGDVNT